jgi:UDP-N-acetylmuramate dehydrogenase
MQEELTKLIGKEVSVNRDISVYFTLKTKTEAEYFFEATTKEDIINCFKAASSLDLPFMLLGGGSNIAVLTTQIKGLVVRNMYQKKEVIEKTVKYTDILLSSGYPMSRVVKETVDDGLSGFEYHKGLPGTVGGAMYMNSKWTKPVTYCGDNLLYAWLLTSQGEVKKVDRTYFHFAYDYSILQETKEIFLEGVFRLKSADPQLLKKRSDAALLYRQKTQPFGVATGGCFFQNISKEDQESHNLPTTSAGYLIDQAGLKNREVGGYIVSDKHANFIINKGQGKPQELRELLDIIKATVRQKFGIELKEEVLLISS